MAVWTDKVTGDPLLAADPNTIVDGFGATYNFGVDDTVKAMQADNWVTNARMADDSVDTAEIVAAAVTDPKVDSNSQAARVVLFSDAVAAAAAEPTPLEYEYTNAAAAGESIRIRCFYKFNTIQAGGASTGITVTCEATKDASAEVAKVKILATSQSGGFTATASATVAAGGYVTATATAYPSTDAEWMAGPCTIDVLLRWEGSDVGKKVWMQKVCVYITG